MQEDIREVTLRVCVCVCVCVCVQSLSPVGLLAIPWAVTHQPPLFMGVHRQEHWDVLIFPPPGDLTDPVIKAMSLAPPAMAGRILNV